MSDAIKDKLLCWSASGLAPHLYVKALSDMKTAADHIDAQDAKIKALMYVLENPVRSDDGLYDYHQTDVDAAIAAAKEPT